MLHSLAFSLPDTGWLIIGCVFVAIPATVGFAYMLSMLRDLRSNLADELRRDITASKEASPVSVQQPLEVKQALVFATRPELDSLTRKMDEELGRERGARKKIHEEISGIQSDLSSIRTQNTYQSTALVDLKRDMKALDTRIDAIPERTIKFLRETKGLL